MRRFYSLGYTMVPYGTMGFRNSLLLKLVRGIAQDKTEGQLRRAQRLANLRWEARRLLDEIGASDTEAGETS